MLTSNEQNRPDFKILPRVVSLPPRDRTLDASGHVALKIWFLDEIYRQGAVVKFTVVAFSDRSGKPATKFVTTSGFYN